MSGIKNSKRVETREVNNIQERKCNSCFTFLSLDHFYSNCKNNKNWIDSICKSCRIEAQTRRQKENKEKKIKRRIRNLPEENNNHSKTTKLLLGDCLELMKDIPRKSIDMILCDLPYGIMKGCDWDIMIDLEKLWKQYKRIIINNSAIVLFATNPFSAKLISSNYKMYKYEWIWNKHIPRGAFLAKHRPMVKHEHILIFGIREVRYFPIMIKRDNPITGRDASRGSVYNSDYIPSEKVFTYNDKYPETILSGMWENNIGKVHPTQKPVLLMEYLIKTYTNEGDTVLDNCMGSGTTGVACKNLNRNFIGMELDEKYFEIAKNRIEVS